jgi:hypothetical protein
VSTAPARLAAWQALSQLFLDTRLDDRDVEAIATQLRATGFSVDELQRMYEEEVAPACWRNLEAVPGGAWAGFDPAWLREAIASRGQAAGGWPLVQRLRVKWWTRRSRPDWLRVREALTR